MFGTREAEERRCYLADFSSLGAVSFVLVLCVRGGDVRCLRRLAPCLLR